MSWAFVYLAVFLLSPLLGSLARADLDSEYTSSAYLDETRIYKLYWKVNNDEKSIRFAVQVKTLGWVGFGISAGKGNMVGSDVVIGWVKENKGYLEDRYADAKALPPIDDKQDYNLLAARESNGETIIEFSRLWDTCDERDNKIESGTVRIIYAYHSEDPSDSIPKHTIRGSRSLILLDVLQNRPSLPQDTEYFDLRHDDTIIPSDDTAYLCKAFEIPQFLTKKHIIQIAPVITYGNEGTVHHMLVYQCRNDFPRSNLSIVSHCYRKNMPPAIVECAGGPIMTAWAIGGGPFVFPNHTGFAIGTSDSPRYVVLEMHYDNPKKISGIHDSSGLRFFYTSSIRKYDAAILFVGATSTYHLMIPPNQDQWLISSYCHRNCTKTIDSSLPGNGINIFATALHSHLQGVSLWTKHVRNGKELPEIARDNHYDFNYQEFRILNKEIHVRPGDDIIQECSYQTKDRSGPVYGGLSTKEEMCLSFLYYYPKVELNQCLSINFGFEKLVEKRFRENGYPPTTWTREFIEDIKKSYDNETRVFAFCRDQNNRRLGADRKYVKKPVINEPFSQPNVCSPTSSAMMIGTKISFTLLIVPLSKIILSL